MVQMYSDANTSGIDYPPTPPKTAVGYDPVRAQTFVIFFLDVFFSSLTAELTTPRVQQKC